MSLLLIITDLLLTLKFGI